MPKMTFKLIQVAKKGGGDKYECKFEGEYFAQYWPQFISRPTGGAPREFLYARVEEEDFD